MKIILVLMAVHVSNPNDVPGKAYLTFDSMKECERVLSTLEFDLKFKSFEVVGQCQKSY